MSVDEVTKWSLLVIASITAFIALKLAEGIVAPVVLALVIGLVLSPLADVFGRIGLGRVPSALLTVLLGFGAIGVLVLIFEPLAQSVINQAPQIWRELRFTVGAVQKAIQGIESVSKEVATALDPTKQDGAGTNGAFEIPRLSDALLFAPTLIGQLILFLGTLFFFVLSRLEIYEWLAIQFDPADRRGQTAQKLRTAERRVSRYFLTITLINAVLGLATAGAMQLIGMPSPLLWGFLAGILNFIVYLGPAFFAGALLVAGIVVFDGLSSFLPVACYVGLNFLEGQFVTPSLIGRSMSVNPLLVFVSLVFWLWLWGPIGGIIAIPLLLWSVALTV